MKTVNEENIQLEVLNKEEKVEYAIEVEDFDIEVNYIEDETELDSKEIQYIERQIRNSYEYRSYIKYLKTELNLTTCSLLPGLDVKDIKFSLEFHHFPLNLYDITNIITKSMLKEAVGKPVSTMDIAKTVIGEHYRNVIGLVPLSKTLHEMAHNNAIVIPLNAINGKYRDFIKEYSLHIEDSTLDRINAIEEYNQKEEALAYNKEKLKKRIVNYNINYIKEADDDV